MKRTFHSLIELVLALSMALSLCAVPAWASESEEFTRTDSVEEFSQEKTTFEGGDTQYDTSVNADSEEALQDESFIEADNGHVDAFSYAGAHEEELKTQAISGKCGKELTWTLEDGTLTISGTGKMDNYFFLTDVPPWYNTNSFDTVDEIKRVVIENGVTSIGELAFCACETLTSVTIPNSVTKIGTRAFEDCFKLAHVNIPDSVTSIGDGAFNHSALTEVTIPNSITEIGEGTFQSCYNLACVTIPNSVSRIGAYAFVGCRNLSSVTIPEPWPLLGEDAFKDTPWWKSFPAPTSGRCGDNVTWNFNKGSGLLTISGRGEVTADGYYTDFQDKIKTVVIEDGVTGLLEMGFSACNNLTSITIPGSVPSITYGSIEDCDNLTTVTIMDGVKRIEYGAFGDCPKLANVIIPASVTFIDNSWVGYGCGKFTISGYTGTIAEDYAIKDGIKFKSIGKVSTPPKTRLTSVKGKKGKKILVEWKDGRNCGGYQLQYSTDKKFKKGVKTIKIDTDYIYFDDDYYFVNLHCWTQTDVKKLKPGKTYYFRIRTVMGSLISGWSAVKSAKAKK